jgi:virginiamycin B lyase
MTVPTAREFTIPTASSSPFQIAPGPDGNVWFTEVNGNHIARITPGGFISEFSVSGNPGGIVAGANGAMWFTEIGGNKIGEITTDGSTVTEFTIPTAGSFTHTIAAGPDGRCGSQKPAATRSGGSRRAG